MKHDFSLLPSWNVVVFSPGVGAGAVTVAPEDLPIKMEVGIEDCLHIEFEYNKSKYHLQVNKNIQKLEWCISDVPALNKTLTTLARRSLNDARHGRLRLLYSVSTLIVLLHHLGYCPGENSFSSRKD